jgi:hypothetical protein
MAPVVDWRGRRGRTYGVGAHLADVTCPLYGGLDVKRKSCRKQLAPFCPLLVPPSSAPSGTAAALEPLVGKLCIINEPGEAEVGSAGEQPVEE